MTTQQRLEERIKRLSILVRELGFSTISGDYLQQSYTGAIECQNGLQVGFLVDKRTPFVEFAFTFAHSPGLLFYLQNRMDEIIRICYEYGCYIGIQRTTKEIAISIFSKLYFTGLNYYSLKSCLKDVTGCIESLQELLDIQNLRREESHENP